MPWQHLHQPVWQKGETASSSRALVHAQTDELTDDIPNIVATSLDGHTRSKFVAKPDESTGQRQPNMLEGLCKICFELTKEGMQQGFQVYTNC